MKRPGQVSNPFYVISLPPGLSGHALSVTLMEIMWKDKNTPRSNQVDIRIPKDKEILHGKVFLQKEVLRNESLHFLNL